MDGRARLTHDQDGVLRRLTFFETSGARLVPALRLVRAQLRALDRRQTVREPWEVGVTLRA